MKELIRNLNLYLLLNTPLTKELVLLEEAMIYVKNMIENATPHIDLDRYPSSTFYFIDSKCWFTYQESYNFIWVRSDIFEKLEEKYLYKNSDCETLLLTIFREIIPTALYVAEQGDSIMRTIEKHFNNDNLNGKY